MRSFTLAAALLLFNVCIAAPQLEERNFKGPSDPARFKFFTTPTQGGICDMDTGPDGISLWYQDLIASKMGYLNPITGKFKEYQIPYSQGPHTTPPFFGNFTGLQCVVRTGMDGMVYGAAGVRNEIVQVNPKTGKLKIFAPSDASPTGNLENFNDAWATPYGLVFSSTTENVMRVFNYKTHKFTKYPFHTPQSGPLGVRTDKHNNAWFTNFLGQKISKFDHKTKKITEFQVPIPGGLGPAVLRASTENQRYLWANALLADGIIRIDTETNELKAFTNPLLSGVGSFPFENDNDYCGRVWYSSASRNNLYYYNPKSDKWTSVRVPGKIPLPTGDIGVAMHRGPLHSMWFTEAATGAIGQYKLDHSCRGAPS